MRKGKGGGERKEKGGESEGKGGRGRKGGGGRGRECCYTLRTSGILSYDSGMTRTNSNLKKSSELAKKKSLFDV